MRGNRRSTARVQRLENAPRGVYVLLNLVTTAGLFCGIYAMAQVIDGAYLRAAIAILVAQVFDVLDGRIARITNSTSRFGLEYDSLCDLISFGVAPSLLVYRWALEPLGNWGWLAPALFVCCAALRLARYNTMTTGGDTNTFTGLPVPAAAAQLATTVILYRFVGRAPMPDKQAVVLIAMYVLAILMVSSVPYLNGKQFRLNKRQPLWILLAGIVLLNFAIARWQLFFFLGATGYVVSGPALWLWRKGRDEGSNGDSGEGDAGAAGGSGGGSSPTLTATAG